MSLSRPLSQIDIFINGITGLWKQSKQCILTENLKYNLYIFPIWSSIFTIESRKKMKIAMISMKVCSFDTAEE